MFCMHIFIYSGAIPYSGKFSPGIEFRQFHQSVQAAKFKLPKILSVKIYWVKNLTDEV